MINGNFSKHFKEHFKEHTNNYMYCLLYMTVFAQFLQTLNTNNLGADYVFIMLNAQAFRNFSIMQNIYKYISARLTKNIDYFEIGRASCRERVSSLV